MNKCDDEDEKKFVQEYIKDNHIYIKLGMLVSCLFTCQAQHMRIVNDNDSTIVGSCEACVHSRVLTNGNKDNNKIHLYCLYVYCFLCLNYRLCLLYTAKFLLHLWLISMQCIRRTNCHDVRPSICLSGTGVHCDHTVHFSTDLSLQLDSPVFWTPYTKACPPTSSHLFPVPPGIEVGYG